MMAGTSPGGVMSMSADEVEAGIASVLRAGQINSPEFAEALQRLRELSEDENTGFANLRYANLAGARFDRMPMLPPISFNSVNLDGAIFNGCKIVGIWMYYGTAQGASFCGADMRQARALQVNFSGANFTNTDMEGFVGVSAQFVNANLRGARLVNAKLNNADMAGAVLDGADITGANLTGAKNLTVRQLMKVRGLNEALIDSELAHAVRVARLLNLLGSEADSATPEELRALIDDYIEKRHPEDGD